MFSLHQVVCTRMFASISCTNVSAAAVLVCSTFTASEGVYVEMVDSCNSPMAPVWRISQVSVFER